MKNITVVLDNATHNQIKHLCVDLNLSLNKYFNLLAKYDMEKRGKGKE